MMHQKILVSLCTEQVVQAEQELKEKRLHFWQTKMKPYSTTSKHFYREMNLEYLSNFRITLQLKCGPAH